MERYGVNSLENLNVEFFHSILLHHTQWFSIYSKPGYDTIDVTFQLVYIGGSKEKYTTRSGRAPVNAGAALSHRLERPEGKVKKGRGYAEAQGGVPVMVQQVILL
jgi:hypothetical protein